MSLTTPEKIRTLQRKLYRKAKAEPTFRFYLLYDKVHREDILRHAYELARANAGAAGVDGMTFARIETLGLEAWLAGLRKDLVSKTYRPDPVRRVSIPKADGVGERLLGIPTIRDRVVQTAAKRAAVDQAVAEGADRGTGRGGNTPQGGVASPLLANIYMNRFLKHWRRTGRGEAFRAHVVAYADDFVILSRGHAAEALAWTKAVMTKLGLTLNEAKTSVRNARQERFDFLGYAFGPHHDERGGERYLGASPSKKSVRRIKSTVSELLVPREKGSWPNVRDRLNRLLQGWSAYFSYGTRTRAYRAVDYHVCDRVRHFLRHRRKLHGRGTRSIYPAMVFGALGVLQLRRVQLQPPPWALR